MIPGIPKADIYGSVDNFTIFLTKQIGLIKPTKFNINESFPHYASSVRKLKSYIHNYK